MTSSSRHIFRVFLSVLVVIGILASLEAAKAPKPNAQGRWLPTGRVAIQTDTDRLFVTVQADGTLRPAGTSVGPAEQFDVYDLGTGIFAFKSVVNGRFLTARRSGSIVAEGHDIGTAQLFRRLGAEPPRLRLRAVAARAFVCAADAGAPRLVADSRCPHASQLLRITAIRDAPSPTFAMTSPAPGSVLRGSTVRFTWDRAGDDAWLNVGTMPGASDLYASGPLGSATEHTVPKLPLNGATIFVQVGRRAGAVVERLDVTYTASVRKGLAVITDFADRRLEDWTGAGIKGVDDLGAQLRSLEAHWAWLSRGTETFRWQIVRIQLTEPAVPDAYPGWGAFRDAAVTLLRQQIDPADYDVNGDDIIDAVWLIVSSGEEYVPFAIGGMSRNAGANLFVDGQASGSVIAGATGNFTHELGHTLALPDMYGTYSTMNKLTVMNDSWAQPPQDFSAYERVKLGWVEPQVVQATTRRVWLPSAHENLDAVMVTTRRPAEYFLIEYRHRPATGYGSAAPDHYAGLAVYHVLEGSSMWQDPPVVKLEPADGRIVPNEPLDPNDFVYPENPLLLRPMVLRSYYDDGQEVFRIENVAWLDDGLAFDIVVAPPPIDQPPINLLANPSFEDGGPAGPDRWQTGSYVSADATFAWTSAAASDGERSAALESAAGNDLWWSQTVGPLLPGERYRLCGVLKGEDVEGVQGEVGANVSLLGGFIRSGALTGTFEWTPRCVDFVAPASPVDVACRLGFYGSTAKGRLWCDDFSLEHLRLRSAFE